MQMIINIIEARGGLGSVTNQYTGLGALVG